MEIAFCRRCGQKLSHQKSDWYMCSNSHNIFANPAPTVGIFLINDKNEVILSVRGIEPDIGALDTIGGFVDSQETIEDAAIREIKEEVNLDSNDYTPLQYFTSAPGKYLYDGEIRHVISNFFWAKLTSNKPLTPMDDVGDIYTAPLLDVETEKISAIDVKAGYEELKKLYVNNLL